jgi:hypothetical protein
LDGLKESVRSYGNSDHTLRGLEKYSAESSSAISTKNNAESYRLDKVLVGGLYS